MPANAIVLELAPHALLQAVLKRTLPTTCTNIGLMSMKAEYQLESFLQQIGKLYQAGASVDVSQLYPSVSYPVRIFAP